MHIIAVSLRAAQLFYTTLPLFCVQETQLLALLKTTSEKSSLFAEILNLYKARVYRVVRKMVVSHEDADDIVQEVFIKVWQHLDTFQFDSHLFTWIYRIATNECLRFLKKKRRFSWLGTDYTDTLMQHLVSDSYLDPDDIQLRLQKAILLLPDKQRLVFNLRHFEELPYQKIAEITGTSVGALKASYHHAVLKIESYLNSY
jgi:RNA polymerase sigma factor (sigma-70 family)